MSREKEDLLASVFLRPEEAGKFFSLEDAPDALPINEYLDGARFAALLAEGGPADCLSALAKNKLEELSHMPHLAKYAQRLTLTKIVECDLESDGLKILSYQIKHAGEESVFEDDYYSGGSDSDSDSDSESFLSSFDEKNNKVEILADGPLSLVPSLFFYRGVLLGVNRGYSNLITIKASPGGACEAVHHSFDSTMEIFFAAPDTTTNPPTLLILYSCEDNQVYLARLGNLFLQDWNTGESSFEKFFEVPVDFVSRSLYTFFNDKITTVRPPNPCYALDSKARIWIQSHDRIQVYSPDFQLLASAETKDGKDMSIHSGPKGEVYLYLRVKLESPWRGRPVKRKDLPWSVHSQLFTPELKHRLMVLSIK